MVVKLFLGISFLLSTKQTSFGMNCLRGMQIARHLVVMELVCIKR